MDRPRHADRQPLPISWHAPTREISQSDITDHHEMAATSWRRSLNLCRSPFAREPPSAVPPPTSRPRCRPVLASTKYAVILWRWPTPQATGVRRLHEVDAPMLWARISTRSPVANGPCCCNPTTRPARRPCSPKPSALPGARAAPPFCRRRQPAALCPRPAQWADAQRLYLPRLSISTYASQEKK